MNETGPPRAVLDSDVIYSRVLHELFGRLATEADLLITSDRGFVAEPLARRGIEVISPDRLLTRTFASEPTAVLTALAEQAAVWGGGRPVGQLLDALERAGAHEFATTARTALSR